LNWHQRRPAGRPTDFLTVQWLRSWTSVDVVRNKICLPYGGSGGVETFYFYFSTRRRSGYLNSRRDFFASRTENNYIYWQAREKNSFSRHHTPDGEYNIRCNVYNSTIFFFTLTDVYKLLMFVFCFCYHFIEDNVYYMLRIKYNKTFYCDETIIFIALWI